MGGAAPAVDANGDLWVSTGNGSVESYKHAYDNSDGVLELSPSLRLLQFFAPADWPVNNSDDLDMPIEPVLLPDGQVILTGKNTIVYLLNGRHLGGIGKQQAKLGPVCGSNIDGGIADLGMIVYLPCLSGIWPLEIAVRARRPSGAPRRVQATAAIGPAPPVPLRSARAFRLAPRLRPPRPRAARSGPGYPGSPQLDQETCA
jgi:hypothetical protein